MPRSTTGIEAFLEVLAGAGVRFLFGNPGTTELPLNDALTRDDRFRYIFGLQEIPILAMADGYAMASGQVGVVNLHVSCGLGNAMGMLYNAFIEGTPLLITAGQQDRRLRLGEPVLEGDLVSVARPWTKWAHEVARVEDMPTAVRRAVQVALTPPTGPVFLSLPLDVQMESAQDLDLSPPSFIDARTRPSRTGLESAADLLAKARNPVILAGSRVTEAKAWEELARLADRLGAPVFAEGTTTHGRLPIRADHPLYRGVLPYWSPEILEALGEFDAALTVGMSLLRLYIHQPPDRPLPMGLQIIHLDSKPWEIGKNYPVEVGLVGDPREGLAELATLVADRMEKTSVELAERRRQEWMERHKRERMDLERKLEVEQGKKPMTSWGLMAALANVLPTGTAVVEEAITTHHNLFERLGVFQDPTSHFAHRGWALGWGLGCALGVKLAWPDRPVLGLLGDGSALYGIQGLWSAAHHRLPVVFVICNNSRYKILQVCGDVMNLPSLLKPDCPGVHLNQPPIDFVGLARALGVEGHRVENGDDLAERVRRGLTGNGPLLLEVPLGD